ncbi:MAG: hypothetical protein Ct9H300mP1_18880 [Planctomycetaceae bacterium]|nr:MAG: hypothetical protein Ct9H300mP1_18880 [Planctomycetaceae bacterium]
MRTIGWSGRVGQPGRDVSLMTDRDAAKIDPRGWESCRDQAPAASTTQSALRTPSGVVTPLTRWPSWTGPGDGNTGVDADPSIARCCRVGHRHRLGFKPPRLVASA